MKMKRQYALGKVSTVALLSRNGEILRVSGAHEKVRLHSRSVFPVMVDQYFWDGKKQLKSAETYKDQIKRVFYPETVAKETQVMLQDDHRRLALVRGFRFGSRVLEVGSSDGSVSIVIAKKPRAHEVLGIA